jgi:hypothetical protein
MPLVARCPYCRQGVRVPARALAASLKCPACQSWYTVFPESEPDPQSAHAAPDDAPDPAPEAVGSGSTPLVVEAPPIPLSTPITNFGPSPVDSAPGSWVHPLGLVACFVGVAALFSASFAATTILTLPLGGIGLALGLLAVLAALGDQPVRQLLPVAGAALSGLVLAAALADPALLGPRYAASRRPTNYDPDAVRFVPLRLSRDGSTGLEADGRADASRAAIQQGMVRVQVVGAAVGPVQVVDAKRKYTKQRYLALAVRVQHLGNGPSVRFVHWGTTGERSVPAATAEASGRKLSAADLGSQVAAGTTYGHDLFPGKLVDDLLVFEAPAQPGPLRVDLPAEAWGGRGVFRFQVPASMITARRGPKTR